MGMGDYPYLPDHNLVDCCVEDLVPGDLFIYINNKRYIFEHVRLANGEHYSNSVTVNNSERFTGSDANPSSVEVGKIVKRLEPKLPEPEYETVQKYLLKTFSHAEYPNLDKEVSEYITSQASLGYDFLTMESHHDTNMWVMSVLLVSYERIPI